MKKKELKSLAKRIAEAELIIQTSTDKKEINDAKWKIMDLSNQAIDLEDIAILDEMVQEILSQKMS
jgi:short-subunit dehydrogenase involved in D-alanine esterification of teichoic acids